jgi:hypothetical protein
VRAELLPPLPARGATCRAGRYLCLPRRIQVRRKESAYAMIFACS